MGAGWADQLGVAGAFDGSVSETTGGTDAAAAAIGQGRIEVSPLAMAVLAGSVGRGTLIAPSLVVDEGSNPRAIPLDGTTVADLRSMMASVVSSGTGTALRDGPVQVRGETGTAEYGSDPDTPPRVWFIGYQGDVAFAVLVEAGTSGGTVAAPIAASFLANLMMATPSVIEWVCGVITPAHLPRRWTWIRSATSHTCGMLWLIRITPSPFAQRLDERQHLCGLLDTQGRRRLVEDDHLPAEGRGTGDRDRLALPADRDSTASHVLDGRDAQVPHDCVRARACPSCRACGRLTRALPGGVPRGRGRGCTRCRARVRRRGSDRRSRSRPPVRPADA